MDSLKREREQIESARAKFDLRHDSYGRGA